MSTPHYDKDFYAWALHSAKLLRQGAFNEVDMEHVAEEIESMGKSDKRQLISRLIVLLAHLLKWQFQPEKQSNSWKQTIIHQRIKIALVLKDSPSLNHELVEMLKVAYQDAVIEAGAETGFLKSSFPQQCPYALSECLDHEFYPEDPKKRQV